MCDSTRHVVEDTRIMEMEKGAEWLELVKAHKEVEGDECCRLKIHEDGPPEWKMDPWRLIYAPNIMDNCLRGYNDQRV